MRVTTKIVFDIDGNVLEHEWYEYEGPVALCDRAATAGAKTLNNAATSAYNEAGANANSEHGILGAKANEWMNTQHGFEPGQLNELLTYGMGGLGGAAGAAQNQTDILAANTRNQSGFTKSLQEQARDRMKAAASMSEGIAAQDVAGAQAKNQAGVGIEQGLFGSDTGKQLNAMGLSNQALETQIQAGKSGWLQNLNDTLGTVAKLGTAFMPKPPGGQS